MAHAFDLNDKTFPRENCRTRRRFLIDHRFDKETSSIYATYTCAIQYTS